MRGKWEEGAGRLLSEFLQPHFCWKAGPVTEGGGARHWRFLQSTFQVLNCRPATHWAVPKGNGRETKGHKLTTLHTECISLPILADLSAVAAVSDLQQIGSDG